MEDFEDENVLKEDENEEVNNNDSNDNFNYSDISEGGWISWFCQMEGNEFFVEISEEFIKNPMNLFDILPTILSNEYPSEDYLSEENIESYQEAKKLYGLIHAKYIFTPEGLALVREKYLNSVYGQCPRILCSKQMLLPVGISNEPIYSRVKVYCPKCEEVYKPRVKVQEIDGCYFGTSFPQHFLLNYPDLEKMAKMNCTKDFIPTLYGFKVYKKKGSKYYDKK